MNPLEQAKFKITPELAMIYIPKPDYEQYFIPRLEEVYKEDIHCREPNRPCHYKRPCNEVPDDDEINFGHEIVLRAYLEDKGKDARSVSISKTTLMIKGEFVGEPDTCFIGVYGYDDVNKTNNYYFGSPFFREFYVSLSAE